jgi:hypothetical protein
MNTHERKRAAAMEARAMLAAAGAGETSEAGVLVVVDLRTRLAAAECDRDTARAEAARCRSSITRLLTVMDTMAKRPVDEPSVREAILAVREAQELAGHDTTGINERLARLDAMCAVRAALDDAGKGEVGR